MKGETPFRDHLPDELGNNSGNNYRMSIPLPHLRKAHPPLNPFISCKIKNNINVIPQRQNVLLIAENLDILPFRNLNTGSILILLSGGNDLDALSIILTDLLDKSAPHSTEAYNCNIDILFHLITSRNCLSHYIAAACCVNSKIRTRIDSNIMLRSPPMKKED